MPLGLAAMYEVAPATYGAADDLVRPPPPPPPFAGLNLGLLPASTRRTWGLRELGLPALPRAPPTPSLHNCSASEAGWDALEGHGRKLVELPPRRLHPWGTRLGRVDTLALGRRRRDRASCVYLMSSAS